MKGERVMKKAIDIMTKNVVTVQKETTVAELANLLATHNIGGAPVVDSEGHLLGVVTESDLIDQTKKVHLPTVVTIFDSVIYLESPNKMEKEMLKMAGSTVGDIFTENPQTVEEGTSLEEIATIMSEKNIHTLPVMRDSELIGVIGKRDIIRTLIP
ncbi:MAG: CBS domain-containing protein [Desulforhopalus sp.]|jgi:CBS domain-containing protein